MLLSLNKTQAAILQTSRGLLVVDEIDLPRELLANQVFVQIITSGICGAQINEIDAVKGPDKFLPHLLGHEGFAKVLDIGPGVTTVVPGDYVVMHWRPGAGKQSVPPEYFWKGKKLNSGWVTTFSNHSVVSENRVTKVYGSNHDKNLLPLLGCALTTAFGVLTNDAKASNHDSILIFGAGGVGLSLIKIAKFLGIKDIVVVDMFKSKLDTARLFGAKELLNFTSKAKTLIELEGIYQNNPPTIAIDTSGSTDAVELCYEISAPKAKVILVGVPKIGTLAKIHTLPLHFGKILKGSHGGESRPELDIPKLLELISNKNLDFTDYPIHEFSLSDINNAMMKLRSGAPGRMIINY